MNNSLYPKYYLFPDYGDEGGGGGDESTYEDTSGDVPADVLAGAADIPGVPAMYTGAVQATNYISPVSVLETGTVTGVVETSVSNTNVLRIDTPLREVVPGTRVVGPGIRLNTTVVSVDHATNSYTLNQVVDTIPDFTWILFTIPKDKFIYKMNIYKDLDGYTVKDIPAGGGFRKIEILGTPGAMFSLTIDKGDDCAMLTRNNVRIPGGSGKIGKYSFVQRFPPTTSEKTYDIQLAPSADVKLSGSIPITTPTYSIKQYVNPIVTFTNKTTIAVDIPTVTTTRGSAGTYASNTRNYATSTKSTLEDYGDVSISWTIDRSEGASGYLYVKKQPSLSDWSNNVDITKTIRSTQEGDRIKVEPHTVDIKKGMEFEGSVSISKLLTSSKYVTDCKTPSSSLVLNNVDDLEVGMVVKGSDINKLVRITAIDEGCKEITISSEEVISNSSILTFSRNYRGTVEEVIDNNYLILLGLGKVLSGTTLEFRDTLSTVISSNLSSTSGVYSPVISGTINVSRFGKENITFTQDLDNILTYTPNAHDQSIRVTKNTLVEINVLAPDTDKNYRVKTPIKVTDPSHGALSGSDFAAGIGTIDYTPTTGFTGEDSFTFKVNDGTTDSDTKTIYLTVK